MARLMGEADNRRRALLEEIEKITETRVIAYLANPNVSPNFLDHNDPIFLNDLLETVAGAKKLDIVIDSPGGEANVAERLASMCRDYSPNVRAIVVNSAKSAATMWAISTDEILMGYISEIGPIDPQIRMISPQGRTTYVPAQSILNSVGQLHGMLNQGLDQRIVMGLIQKLDPAIIDVAQNAINFSREFAYRWLSQHMLREDLEKAKEVADALSDNRRWLSHGKRIGIREATDLGLKITRIRRDTRLWKLLWEYYGRSQIAMNTKGLMKLYESKTMGINFTVTIQRRPLRAPERPPPSTQEETDLIL